MTTIVHADPILIGSEMLNVTPNPILATPGLQPNWTVQLQPDLLTTVNGESATDAADQLATGDPANAFAFSTNSFTGGTIVDYLGPLYDRPANEMVTTTFAILYVVPAYVEPEIPETCEMLGTCTKTPPPPPPVPEPKGTAAVLFSAFFLILSYKEGRIYYQRRFNH